ncbi:MAG TPA: SRPBCC domain-containing protein [Anaerolineales bacterium]
MEKAKDTLSFEFSISAPTEAVFYAFSTGQGWRDWLCDQAIFQPRAGGTYHLGWDTGWYVSGRVEELEKPNRVRLSWRGAEDPAASVVRIELNGHGDHTHGSVEHFGFGEGEAWEDARQKAQRGWEVGLENLESIFSTGADLRITRRPMVGMMGNDFNEKIAAQFGVPVSEGVRLADTVEGMGAAKAGLQSNDVIVELAGKPIRSWPDLGKILQQKRAGESIPLAFYRGGQRHEVVLQLSARPIPETPLDPVEFAHKLRQLDAEVIGEIREVFRGISEAEAEFAPPGEWSAKQNLAHLIKDEEENLHRIGQYLNDSEAQYVDAWENRWEPLDAILGVSPSVEELIDRLAKAKETTALVLEASEEPLRARKGVMWRIGMNMLHFPGSHEREHLEQVKRTLEAARAAEPAAQPM